MNIPISIIQALHKTTYIDKVEDQGDTLFVRLSVVDLRSCCTVIKVWTDWSDCQISTKKVMKTKAFFTRSTSWPRGNGHHPIWRDLDYVCPVNQMGKKSRNASKFKFVRMVRWLNERPSPAFCPSSLLKKCKYSRTYYLQSESDLVLCALPWWWSIFYL